MNHNRVRLFIGTAALLLVCLAGPAAAGRPGSVSGTFLTLGAGARAAALGNASAAVPDDVSALYWNPAGLGRLRSAELQFVHTEWLGDLTYDYVGYVHGTPAFGGFAGGSVTYLDYGSINVTRINGQTPVTNLGIAEASDLALQLSWGAPGEWVDYGFSVKYIEERMEEEQGRAYAIDAGLRYPLTERVTLGATLQNLGTKLKFQREAYALPLTWRLGGCWTSKDGVWLATADVILPSDDSVRLGGGVEYRLTDWLRLRGGYNTQSDAGPGYALGFGIDFRKGWKVDYAYVPYGGLGDTHRFSLNWKFGPPAPVLETPSPAERHPAAASRPQPPPAYYPPAPAAPPAPVITTPAPAVLAPPAAYPSSSAPAAPAEEEVQLPVPIYVPPLE